MFLVQHLQPFILSDSGMSSVSVQLMALLLLRHTLTITNSDDEDDTSAIFSVRDFEMYSYISPIYIVSVNVNLTGC